MPVFISLERTSLKIPLLVNLKFEWMMDIKNGLSLSSKAAGGEKMELGGKWWMSWVISGVCDLIELNEWWMCWVRSGVCNLIELNEWWMCWVRSGVYDRIEINEWWMCWVRSGVYDRIEINTKFWVNYIFQYKLPVFNPTTTGASQTCRIWLKLKYFAKI